MREEMTITTISDAITELEEENSRMYSFQNHHRANTMAINALKGIDAIRQEIEELKPYAMYADGMVKKSEILQIIDRHMKGDSE